MKRPTRDRGCSWPVPEVPSPGGVLLLRPLQGRSTGQCELPFHSLKMPERGNFTVIAVTAVAVGEFKISLHAGHDKMCKSIGAAEES